MAYKKSSRSLITDREPLKFYQYNPVCVRNKCYFTSSIFLVNDPCGVSSRYRYNPLAALDP